MQEFNDTLIKELLNLQLKLVDQWHQTPYAPLPESGLSHLVCQQHLSNYELWHLEDDARATVVSDAVIAGIKRSIDKVNQRRNNQIELVDEYLVSILDAKFDDLNSPMNTETPGSVFDRLSINALKIFHMGEQVNRSDATPQHVQMCKNRVALLIEQRLDLSSSLVILLDDLYANRKRLKVYRQVKMYNDQQLNPVLSKENSVR